MKRLSIEQVSPGAIAMQAIYDKNFNVLVKKYSVLNEKTIDTIRIYGYESVFVETGDNFKTLIDSGDAQGLPYEEIGYLLRLMQKSYKELEVFSKRKGNQISMKVYKQFNEFRESLLEALNHSIEKIIISMIHNRVTALQIIESKSLKLYTFQHSLQTALISTLMGIKLKLSMTELKVLFMSAIIMEFSNVSIPQNILDKKDRLTESEFEIVKKHPFYCYEEFGDSISLHYLVKVVCLQHHEKFNGTGYPKGLSGEEIHPLARIVSVADAFDALISDRHQRKAHSIPNAIKYLEAQSDVFFFKSCVDLLKTTIYPFAIGERVTLNVGEGKIIGYDENANPMIELEQYNKHVKLSENGFVKLAERDLEIKI